MSWPSVNPGDLRHSIEIQSQSGATDAIGQPLLDWLTVVSCRAGKDLVSMREAFGIGQFTAESNVIWTIRWPSETITPGMRIMFNDRVFFIQAANNVSERNVIVHLLCRELNAPVLSH